MGSRPGCAGAKPRRRPQTFFQGHPVTVDVGTQPFCRHAVPAWLPHAARSTLPSRSAGTPRQTMRTLPRTHLLSMSTCAGPAAGFRPALPGPVASNCFPIAVRRCQVRFKDAAWGTANERGWTPHRPSAAVVRSACSVPSGRACRKLCEARVRVLPGCGRSDPTMRLRASRCYTRCYQR